MKTQIILSSILAFSVSFAVVPSTWAPRGIGGGGSLFSPSINPTNDNEYFVACDMSELFHTTNYGRSYSQVNGSQMLASHYSKVQYTNIPGRLYTLDYSGDYAHPVVSNDAGIHWTAMAGNPDTYDDGYSFWVDNQNPAHMLYSTYSVIYFSGDTGKTFTQVYQDNSGAGANIGGVFFSGDSIYVGTNFGILTSTTGGKSFTMVAMAGVPTTEAAFSFTAAKVGNTLRFFALTGKAANIYVGLQASDYWNFLQGIYTQDNATGTWTKRMTGINVASDFLMHVAMSKNDINTVYAAGSGDDSRPHVFKSIDAGLHWTSVFLPDNNTNIVTGWSGYGGDRDWTYGETIFGFAVADSNPNRLLITDFGFVHGSTNGGASWRQAYVDSADEHPAKASTPQKASYASIGLENTSVWQVAWGSATDMFAGYSDIRGLRSTDGGTRWSFDYKGHTDNTMYWIAQAQSGTMYAATSSEHDMYESTRLADSPLDAGTGKILTSADHGATWTTLHDFQHVVYWVALDPTSSTRMYASMVNSTLGGVYVSNNIDQGAASTWTRLSAPPRTEGHPAAIQVLSDGRVLCSYSGHRTPNFTASSGVFLYTPSTKTWTDVSDAGMYYWTRDVVVSPYDAKQKTWYASVNSGWGGAPNGLGGLYRTTNAGQSWTRIATLDRVRSCTIHPTNPDVAFITTESEGLWMSQNFSANAPTFTRVDGYPFAGPERVFINPYDQNEVWVTSFGNGMYVGRLDQASANHIASKLSPLQIHRGVGWLEVSGSEFSLADVGVFAVNGRNLSQVQKSIQGGVLRLEWNADGCLPRVGLLRLGKGRSLAVAF